MAMYVSKDNHILVEEGVSLDDWTKKTEQDIQDLRNSTQVSKYIKTIDSTLFIPDGNYFKYPVVHGLGNKNITVSVRDSTGDDVVFFVENTTINGFNLIVFSKETIDLTVM